MRIVFMGTPEFAVMPLRALVEAGHDIAAVVTSVDKPAGRGLRMHESAVKQYAVQAGIPVLQPEKLKDPGFLAALRGLDADLGIVIAFRMLPREVWSMPRLGTFNLHASLLPQYRGAAPINWAVINGEKTTGVTTFFLNDRIDEGDIIAQSEVAIGDRENAGSLHDRLMAEGARLVTETVDIIASGNYSPVVQPVTGGELKPAPKLFKETCRINWDDTCADIYNKIRGLSPYPAAWSEIAQADGSLCQIKIFDAEAEVSPHAHPPGRVFSDGRTFLKISCRDGYIRITDLQAAGKRRMKVDEFLRGRRVSD